MKKALIGLVAVIVVTLVGGYFLGLLPLPQSPPPDSQDEVGPPPAPPPSDNQEPASPPPSPPPPAEGEVKFELVITDISGSGLTRTITAQLPKTGSADAPNAWTKIEVFSGRSLIKLGGADFLRDDIGVVKAGETVTRQVTLSFSAFDGLKISRNGARFMLTISSDEHTETFSYEYQP